jgi:hypothetical protein
MKSKITFDKDGRKKLWINNDLRCIDDKGSKFWFFKGKFHRENGPAIEWSNGTKDWYFNHIEYSEQEWLKIILFNEVTITLI